MLCVCVLCCGIVVIKYRLIEKDCNNNKKLSTADAFLSPFQMVVIINKQ